MNNVELIRKLHNKYGIGPICDICGKKLMQVSYGPYEKRGYACRTIKIVRELKWREHPEGGYDWIETDVETYEETHGYPEKIIYESRKRKPDSDVIELLNRLAASGWS